MEISKKIKDALNEERENLLSKKNVVAVGVGNKRATIGGKKDQKTGKQAIICFVKKKVPVSALSADDLIPKTIEKDGKHILTDVIEIGNIRALGINASAAVDIESAADDHAKKHRPIRAGTSCGHYKITAGTFGLPVISRGKLCILSNNHVLANSNSAKIGDAILQPGRYDGGTMNDAVAELFDFEFIDFNGRNEIDAALAIIDHDFNHEPDPEPEPNPQPDPEPDSGFSILKFLRRVIDYILSKIFSDYDYYSFSALHSANFLKTSTVELDHKLLNFDGEITGNIAKNINVGDVLKKSGRTTGFTSDEIIATNVTVDVDYGTNGIARFENQIMAGRMSLAGDSGSAVFNDFGDLIGLLFAGSESTTIINPIDKVFKRLSIEKIYTG